MNLAGRSPYLSATTPDNQPQNYETYHLSTDFGRMAMRFAAIV